MDWLLNERAAVVAFILGLVAFVIREVWGWAKSWKTRQIAENTEFSDQLNDHGDRIGSLEQNQAVHAEKHKHHESRDEELERDVRQVNERIDRFKGGG